MSLVFSKDSSPFLYLGGKSSAENEYFLQESKITHILNLAEELKNYFPEKYKYKKLDLEDNEECDISKYFEETNEFIQEAYENNGKILVHCVGGVSRSSTVTISYLMKHQKMTLREAFDFVKEKRQEIQPNLGFFKQLIEYEDVLFGSTTITVKDISIDELDKMFEYEFDKKTLSEIYDRCNGDMDQTIEELFSYTPTM
eukprot:gene7910-12378_t